MNIRPDPTFHASPKLAMEAPPESFAYAVLLSPDFSRPDALAVIDVNPNSQTYSRVVHTVTMPNKGDEFHHFGWNACSSSLSPLSSHTFLQRRYLIIPGITLTVLGPPTISQATYVTANGETLLIKSNFGVITLVDNNPLTSNSGVIEAPMNQGNKQFAWSSAVLLPSSF